MRKNRHSIFHRDLNPEKLRKLFSVQSFNSIVLGMKFCTRITASNNCLWFFCWLHYFSVDLQNWKKMILINHKTGNHQLIAKYFEELAFHPLFQIVALINQAIISNHFQESKNRQQLPFFHIFIIFYVQIKCSSW